MLKIIDDKGFLHIFKWRINIIDFLVLMFILCLMPMFWFGYKIFTREPEPIKPPTITLDKAEYENEIAKLKRIIAEQDRKKENFLKEYRRARKYF